ncbi:MAG: amidase [Gemmatimonadota bacterium]
MEALYYADIRDLSPRIRNREISPVEVVRTSLDRIERLNPSLNAFITVLSEQALSQAHAAEEDLARGKWRGPLHGIPVGIKDMFDTAGIRTTAAFEHFQDRVPTKDAVTVSRLKQAGAIIVGKMNMHQLAMGTTSTVSFSGPVHNPWNARYVAGGSSGGSAAAVSAGMCYATVDTDAIGSCRLPASCCGVTGYKGTYGLINGKGILDGEPVEEPILRLAHVAITTRGAGDAALMLDVLAEREGGSAAYFAGLDDAAPLQIGVATNFQSTGDVGYRFSLAVEEVRQLGYPMIDVRVPIENPGFDVHNIEADRRMIAGNLFRDCDVVILPTCAAPTPAIRDAMSNPLAVSPENTLFANYYGLPAISVPSGFNGNGLPFGLQIVGRPNQDAVVLRVADQYQHATGWARKHPLD